MHRPRSRCSLLLVLGALAMLATPVTAMAAGPTKEAPATAKKGGKVDKARSDAAKRGAETRRMKRKAEANWASRIAPNARNPKPNTPEAHDAFIRHSVAAQRGWQKRKAQTGKKKVVQQTGRKTTRRPAGSTRRTTTSKVASKDEQATSARQPKAAPGAQSPQSQIEAAGVGAADLRAGLAKLDKARLAASEDRQLEAAVAEMEGHDMVAKAAFATADAYAKAGQVDEANKLIEFGNEQVAKADAMEAALDTMQPRGPIRRFLSWLNPFKKRGGGGDVPAPVAGE